MPSSGRWLVFVRGGFRRLRAATFFFHGEKEGKTPPGTAQMSADALIFAFPRTPFYGGRTTVSCCWISGAKNLSGFYRFIPGHWAVLFAGGFRRLRAATFFLHGEKEGKTPPGTAQMSAPHSYSPFPGPLLRGTPYWEVMRHFRRAKSGVLACVSFRAHWGHG